MQFLLMFVALYAEMVHSWDFATSAGDDTLSFYTNDTLTSTISIESRKLYALTYDEVHNMMLYVDKHTNNDSVCGYDLTTMENKCFTEESGMNIHDLVFDPVTERVFFTDTNERSINWVSLKPGSNNNVNILIKVYDGIPRDIVVDSCEGYIYWLNIRPVRSKIERTSVEGTEKEVFETIINTIYVNATFQIEPSSLAIDQTTRWIYWLEPASTSEYRLFHGALNMKFKEFVVKEIAPNYIINTLKLTVSKNSVIILQHGYGNVTYVMSCPKTFDKLEKKKVYTVGKMPISIVANYKIKDQIQGCEALSQVKISTEYDGPYCVHGLKVIDQSACKCTPGYIGERCDVSVCDNYCLQGNCIFTDEGLPECRCNAGYTGERCKVNRCLGYCLNNGECFLNEEDEPSCKCVGGYDGTRCAAVTSATSDNDTLTILVNHRGESSTYSCLRSNQPFIKAPHL